MKLIKYILLSVCCVSSAITYGQNNLKDSNFDLPEQLSQPHQKRFEHKLLVGFNLGATAPIPLPKEVRSINGWWPQFTPQIGYSVHYRANEKWGIGSGIMLNYKGMGVKDKVKYMYTEVKLNKNDQGLLKGYFVGKNETHVKSAYVTIPLYVSLQTTPKWRFKLGGYASYLFSGQFNGTVSDGYLRVGSPLGQKMEISEATFDFNDHMRDFDFGLTFGAEKKVNRHFGIYGNLDWGLTSIFPSSFQGLEYGMYNIYLTIGLSYRL